MAETQSAPAIGTFCWNEVMTTDVEKAKAFYTQLFGWTSRDVDMGPGGTYTIWMADGKDVGGCMKLTPEMAGVPPHWMAYVAVKDVDATAAQVEKLGGSLIMPPTDIPNIGRFAILKDPAGAVVSFITMKG